MSYRIIFLISLFLLLPKGYASKNDMLDAADVNEGKIIAVGCTGCHTLEKNGENKTGPNLFNIVGAKRARNRKFQYSPALLKFKSQKWDVDSLDEWLKDPEQFAPGTKMSFPGISDPQDRMDVIAYLKTLK